MSDKKETDYMIYKGNSVPGFIKFVWLVFTIFMFFYLIRFALPDLMTWINK